MSGGLTLCRQLRPSSRREHVIASKSYMEWGKKQKQKQTTTSEAEKSNRSQVKSHKSLYSAAAFKNRLIPAGAQMMSAWLVNDGCDFLKFV